MDDRHVRLPRWGSAEGFHLMESFVTSIDNPAYREQLSRALTMGKGVFRAFKDTLKRTRRSRSCGSPTRSTVSAG